MSQIESTERPQWELAAILSVDKEDRVQCQCKGCGQGVYAQIHIIEWADGRIECWGSTCYTRELGSTPYGRQLVPVYGNFSGRKLTAQEREDLLSNRERLIARFKEARDREMERAKAQHLPPPPLPPAMPARPDWSRPRREPERPLLRDEARQTIELKWIADGVDHTLAGFAGLFEQEVEREYQRLRAASR